MTMEEEVGGRVYRCVTRCLLDAHNWCGTSCIMIDGDDIDRFLSRKEKDSSTAMPEFKVDSYGEVTMYSMRL